MTLADLLFLLLAFSTVASLAAVGIHALRRRPTASLRRFLAFTWLAYGATLLAVSLLSPQRYVEAGSPQCADDWCLTLVDAVASEIPAGREYLVSIDLTNRGLGRPQRERFVSVHLVQHDGVRVNPLVDMNAVPFDTMLTPGVPMHLTRRFRLVGKAPPLGMVVAREGLGRIPGCCIIGSDESFWHKPTLIRLPSH